MKSGKLLVIALLGLAVLGYVVVELAGGSDAKTTAAYARDGEPSAERRGNRAASGRETAASSRDATTRKGKNVVVPVNAEPPPPPPPPMPLEQARAEFEQYITALEQVKSDGRMLETEEWTDWYKRGNDALDPLVRALDSSKPPDVAELNDANRRFRELIMSLEPRAPAPPP